MSRNTFKQHGCILVPENNEKQNPDESCMNKYQKHVACSHGYKLACVDDEFSKFFMSYLVEDPVYNFINNTIAESKYCTDIMKKHFKKKIIVIKKDNEDFKNSAKYWICDVYVEGGVKVRYHCYITGKYRGSAHRDGDIDVILERASHHSKTFVLFAWLKAL